ncbi:MAG TPA: PfkB family carbohydrate kinase [Jatrophihabitans sp.]|nr:PfkB family carbohydrate kinase [Jatrophihabitans sp.]
MTERRPDVIVIGSVNVDLQLLLPRLPGPGTTVTGGRLLRCLGGKGANQAAAAARLGARTALIGRVGDDAEGAFAREALAAAGVEVGQLQTVAGPTGVATVLSDPAGENLIGVASGANASLSGDAVLTALESLGRQAAVLVANLEVPVAAVASAAGWAHRHGCTFVLNPAPAQRLPLELLDQVSVLTPNEHEAVELDFAGTQLITRGAAGVELVRPGLPALRVPAFAMPVVDTTGAGDACTAALAWALAAGVGLESAAVLAAAAGSLAVRGAGAQGSLPTAAEVHRSVERGERL